MQNEWRGKGPVWGLLLQSSEPAEEGQGKREEVILREGRNVPGTSGGKKKDSQLERMEN